MYYLLICLGPHVFNSTNRFLDMVKGKRFLKTVDLGDGILNYEYLEFRIFIYRFNNFG